MPLPLLQAFEREGRADLAGVAAGVLRLAPEISGLKSGAPIPFPSEQYDVRARLAGMDADGVERHAVSAPPFLFAAGAPDDTFALDVTRRSNDALADYVAEAPERLVCLGTVPVGRPGAADEARRCLDVLGCVGVALGSSGGGRELDDPMNEDVWALLAERRAFVFLHPSGTSSPQRFAEYYLVQLLGFPADTALAAARLILGGVLDRHPNLTICLAHGGGCLPVLRGRFDHGWHNKPQAHTSTNPPGAYFQRFQYDTAVFDPRQVQRLVADMGVERVLLGTDFPFDLADRDPRGTLAAAALADADLAAILGGNARRALNLQR